MSHSSPTEERRKGIEKTDKRRRKDGEEMENKWRKGELIHYTCIGISLTQMPQWKEIREKSDKVTHEEAIGNAEREKGRVCENPLCVTFAKSPFNASHK